mgnify:CR=1 FL=1
MLSGAPPIQPTSRNMYIDHTGTKYSISTDDEDRFDYLIKKITSCSFYSNQTYFKYLQQVQLLSVNTTSFAANDLFRGLNALESVSVCDLPNSVNVYNMFYDCYKLQKAPYFDTTNAQNFTNMFTNCFNLLEVPKYKKAIFHRWMMKIILGVLNSNL